MNRLLTCVCLGVALNSWGQQAASTNEAAQPRPVYRYLFLIDTSSGMSRQKTVTMDTVSRLILSGFGGRIHSGDAWNLWTFDDQLHTNASPAQMWDPRQRRESADRAYRLVLDQHFKKKKGRLDKPLDAITDEASFSGDLTVFLFTDGSQPVKGTPFDGPINEVFTQHATGMRKAKKPFVTVLVAHDGKFAAHAVSPGGEAIYIPRLAIATAPAKPPEKDSATSKTQANSAPGQAATATPDAATAQPPPKKVLTVQEISQALQQSEKKPTNTVAVVAEPSIIGGGNSNPAAPDERGQPNAETPAPNSNATSLAAQKNISAPAQTTVPSSPGKGEGPIASAEPTKDHNRQALVSSSASPQTGAIVQAAPSSNAWKYLAAAAALMLVALTLACFYVRSIRYVPQPSLISRCMEKEKMKCE